MGEKKRKGKAKGAVASGIFPVSAMNGMYRIRKQSFYPVNSTPRQGVDCYFMFCNGREVMAAYDHRSLTWLILRENLNEEKVRPYLMRLQVQNLCGLTPQELFNNDNERMFYEALDDTFDDDHTHKTVVQELWRESPSARLYPPLAPEAIDGVDAGSW